MDFKKSMQQLIDTIKRSWKSGRIQRSSRITYGVVWNVILFFLIIGCIGMFFVGGIGAGYFASLVKDEEIRDYETMAQDIYDYAETSRMYFANNIFLGEVSADLHRDETTLDQIAPHLIDAVIATEDEYFNEHDGIVPKAILRAVYQEVSNAATQTGGSTLTQQLIKNQILTNEVSFERKAKEILLALRLERFFEKDEILEAYLNIVPYGRNSSGSNIAGIQTAAQGIFGIDAKDVNLAQAAYLAGLPQSPSAYTPFANGGGLKSDEGIEPGLNRMKTVLNRMLDMEYITEKQYEEALAYDIVSDFKEEEPSPIENYPVLTTDIQSEAQEVLKNMFMEEDGVYEEDLKKAEQEHQLLMKEEGISEEELQKLEEEYQEMKEEHQSLIEKYQIQAKRALQTNGYEIHTTIDKELYDLFQDIGQNFNQYGNNTMTEHPKGSGEFVEQAVQGAAIMIENSTGRIISYFGNRSPDINKHLNYARQTVRSNGSSMKPILVYGPAMEEGLIQPGTPIADAYLKIGTYAPDNIDFRYTGLQSARSQLARSRNIPAIRAYSSIMDINPVDKYMRKMGITTLGDTEYSHLSLSIGGTSRGISIEENANAYSTVANSGQFADGYIIEKITTKDGEIVYEHKHDPVEVFSPQTSYLLIDMMRDVISRGTANGLKSMLKYPHVDWAGKTGTSQFTHDVHFVASNPNITFATWMGYEIPDSLDPRTHYRRNQTFWAEFINAASDLRPELVAPEHTFQQPEGIVRRSYCAISGKLPSELCERAGLVKTDLFNEKFVPTERDNSLTTGSHILVNGKAVAAGSNTPGEFTNGNGLMFNPEFLRENGYDKLPDLRQLIPQNEDRGKWEKIGFPNVGVANQINDDGEAPKPPTSLSGSANTLTWNPSSSNDVVGYRIFRAAKPGDNFKRVGSVASPEFKISADGVYHVRAVDYFGLESEASSNVVIGETPEKENETPDENKEDDTKDEKQEEVKDEEKENNDE